MEVNLRLSIYHDVNSEYVINSFKIFNNYINISSSIIY